MKSRGVRTAFWISAILLGLAQTWYTRHRVFSDGISYLNIARQYSDGNFHCALNAYWSPLYSWLVAVYLWIAQPSPYWEVSALHVVNFAAFLASCWIFENFLFELTRTRPAGSRGFPDTTIMAVGYIEILHAGLLMIGIGYVSPDMIAFFLTGMMAWLTLKIARGERQFIYFAALGVTLGLGYLDRTAFLPTGALYILSAAILLVKRPGVAARRAVLSGACLILTAAPFVTLLSIERHSFTLGESGKLNYGWEVAGAVRSVNWQGEPGDLGTPLHPTRMVLQKPVPVFEFAEPVGGYYPPWYDPSYWYAGIQPHLKVKEQLRVFWHNLRTMLIFLAATPAFLVWMFALAVGRGRGLGWSRWPRVYWALLIPTLAGVAMYCLVFIDKRYIAGFFAVIWITLLACVELPDDRFGKLAGKAAGAACLLFAVAMVVWLRPAIVMSVQDIAARHEGEMNVSWMMAQRFTELGLKPGDRVAYVGTGISADWVRLAKAKIVAEVPVKWERSANLLYMVGPNEEYPLRFFQLDQASREKIYQVFEKAGAVIAVTGRVPKGGIAGDWQRLLNPKEPHYPTSGGQVMEQSPGYYRWLKR